MTNDLLAIPFFPEDVWIQILSFLERDALALAYLSQTCRRLEGIVKTYSALYPQILGALLVDSFVDKAGLHVRTGHPSKSVTLHFNALECWDGARCLRRIIPNDCFEGAVRSFLIDASTAKEHLIFNSSSSHTTPFFRTTGEYDYSLLHKVGHLSLAEDCVDFVFDLSADRVQIIKSHSVESNMIGLRLKDVISAALESIEANNRVFHSLQARVMQRQRVVDERSRKFRDAAKKQSALYPKRRHVAERLFVIGKWTKEYSLLFLQQCQKSIAEEMREQRLHRELKTGAKMSLSPYSCLSAKYISGDLANARGMTDSCAFDFTVRTLQEIEFAHRNTVYAELKRIALVRGESAESNEHGCGSCFWSSRKEVMALIAVFLGSEGSPEQIREMKLAQSGHSQTSCGENLGFESTVSKPVAKRRRLNAETKPSAPVTNVAQPLGFLELGKPTGESDEESEWYVVETHDDGIRVLSTTFYIDDWFDATPRAAEIREWSLFLYACKSFVQLDKALSASDTSVSLNDLPDNISMPLRDMLHWLRERQELHNGLVTSTAPNRLKLVTGILCHSLTSCHHHHDSLSALRSNGRSSAVTTGSQRRTSHRSFLSTMTRCALSYSRTRA